MCLLLDLRPKKCVLSLIYVFLWISLTISWKSEEDMLRLTLTMLLLLLMKLSLVLAVHGFCVLSQIYYIIKIKIPLDRLSPTRQQTTLKQTSLEGRSCFPAASNLSTNLARLKVDLWFVCISSTFFPALTDPSLIMHCLPLSVNWLTRVV